MKYNEDFAWITIKLDVRITYKPQRIKKSYNIENKTHTIEIEINNLLPFNRF